MFLICFVYKVTQSYRDGSMMIEAYKKLPRDLMVVTSNFEAQRLQRKNSTPSTIQSGFFVLAL